MKTKIKQGLKWIVAAIFLMIVMKLVLGLWGGHPFHGAHEFRPYHGMGHGQPHMMRGQAFMGGFQWIWTLVTIAFWSGVIVILVRWFRRKTNSQIIQQPFSYPSYSSHVQSVDFLDEWEKNQMKPKEDH